MGKNQTAERRLLGGTESKVRLMVSNKEEKKKKGMIWTDENGCLPSCRLTVMDANEQLEGYGSDGSVFARMEAEPRKLPPCGRWNRLCCFRAHKHSCCPKLKQNDYSLTPEHLLLRGQVGQAAGTLMKNTSRFWAWNLSLSGKCVICDPCQRPTFQIEKKRDGDG